jgi:ubiquitin carboxyl-terminal hydrolase 8
MATVISTQNSEAVCSEADKLSTSSEDDIEQKRSAITELGLSGLLNIGNTCYMNSPLQCLLADPMFSASIIKKLFFDDTKNNIQDHLADIKRKKEKLPDNQDVDVYLSDIKQEYLSTITYNVYKLFKKMWAENCAIAPKKLKAAICQKNEEFKGFRQNDSQELLSYVLDTIHEENKTPVILEFKNVCIRVKEYMKVRTQYNQLISMDTVLPEQKEKMMSEFKRFDKEHLRESIIFKSLDYWQRFIKKNHSFVTDIFMGLFTTHTICKSCKEVSAVFEPFTILPLQIPDNGNTTLAECLKNFSSSEEMNGDNKYRCDTCKTLTEADKSQYIWTPPESLIIQLKRFKIDNSGRVTSKISTMVDFPLTGLSLSDNYSEYHTQDALYDLYAITHHTGSLGGGHYIAYTKNQINNKWYEFNDDDVVHVPDEAIESELISRSSYILFYKKRVTQPDDSD